jgi:transcriptional regulator with PAS, ATPase and Fis domain
MAQSWKALQADNKSYAVSITPIARLARCVNTEDVLAHLAHLAAAKGVVLYSVKLMRTGLCREWQAQEVSAADTELHEIEAPIEGVLTHLSLRLAGRMDAAVRCELEDAAYLAAQRIELCERRLWGREGREEPPTFKITGIIGNSEPMQGLGRSIQTAAGCDSTTLITGESGTGKELAARAIHQLGARADKPFIAINCGAFTESLLESELFGYVKGAFTGALANRKGLFEAAHQGTIFLDEIGEMPLPMQVKLLRILQERKVRPLGAHRETEIDVRVIAATNRALRCEVAEKRFREDLYYRLNVLAVRMPSLKERREDIPELVRHFLKTSRQKLRRSLPVQIEETAMLALCGYSWPGNIRELENMVERLAAETEAGGVISVELVSREIGTRHLAVATGDEIEYSGVLRAGEPLDEHFLRQQLKIYELVRAHVGGNHSRAARWLGIERTALYHRLERARQKARVGINRS